MNIKTIIRTDSRVIKVSGRVDTNNAYMLDAALQSIKIPDKAIIDCEELEYASSSGLGVLLRARKRLGKDNIKLIDVGELLFEIFQVTGFDTMLTIERKQ